MKLPVLAARAAAGRLRNKEGSHRREATTRSLGVRVGGLPGRQFHSTPLPRWADATAARSGRSPPGSPRCNGHVGHVSTCPRFKSSIFSAVSFAGRTIYSAVVSESLVSALRMYLKLRDFRLLARPMQFSRCE